jgi:predicted Fe-S protein YdhL (DUF1289 family)
MTELEALAGLAELAQSPDNRVPSPCISVCRMDDASGLCLGCFRTLDEIIQWGRAGDAEKRVVWQLIAQRAGIAPAANPASTA